MICDSCISLSEYQFRLIEKKWATSYMGEGVSASFTASQGSGFDSRFPIRYVLLPGICSSGAAETNVDNCIWNVDAQIDWTPDYMYYDASAQTYEWLWMIPSDVVVGSQYQLIIYGYDHWNTDVSSVGYAYSS